MAFSLLSIIYRVTGIRFCSATYLVYSAQPYSTVPYSHGTLGAWPHPRDHGIARWLPQYPNTQTTFSISWHRLMAPASSESQKSRQQWAATSDVSRRCQPDTTVLCHEHTVRTGFTPGCVTSAAPDQWSSISDIRNEQTSWVAAFSMDWSQSCRYRVLPTRTELHWSSLARLVSRPVWARRAEEEPAIWCGSGAVPNNTLGWCRWHGSSWRRRRRCRHQDPGQLWPSTLIRHRHKPQSATWGCCWMTQPCGSTSIVWA